MIDPDGSAFTFAEWDKELPSKKVWPRQESNLHLQNRNLKYYPLYYGAK